MQERDHDSPNLRHDSGCISMQASSSRHYKLYMEDHLPKCRRKIMATFYLNTSPICSFNRKSVHSPVNAKHYRPMPKKRTYPTLPCLMISPVQTPISHVSCGKGNFDERGYGTPQGVAKDDGIAIRSFLKGKRIIVTGATGFIAKGIVEKILRTAPDVDKLYILIKAEDNEDARSRLVKEIIHDEVFWLLKEEHGKFYNSFMLSKLVAVAGNLREDGLGINPESAYEMQNIVDVILHSAGNTTFDERFDVSLDINTKGSCRIMKFAKGCKNIKLFLHLSTAFACGQQEGKIMEEPYFKSDQAPLFDTEKEMRLAFDHTNFQESDNKAISNKMKSMGLNRAKINGWQDTYSFTKAMTEVLLDQMRDDIPLVIIRPSIVQSSFKSPYPGWIQGNKTIDPVIILFGKGRLTSLPGNPDTIFDIVPVDMVVNATMAAMARHGTGERKPKLEVYHVTSSNRNPIRLSEVLEYVYQHFNLNPLMDRQGHPILVKSSVVLNSMEEYSTQTMSLASHVHNSRIQKKAMEQLHHLGKIYEPYTFFKAWFDDTNTVNLLNALSKEEREVFDFDVKNINWMDYYMNIHVPGLKTHVMMGRGSTPIPSKFHATKP